MFVTLDLTRLRMLQAYAMTMGERLRELRQARGLSLQQAATPIGCSKPHLWEIERGMQRNPTLDLLRRLASYYGVTVAYIIDDAP